MIIEGNTKLKTEKLQEDLELHSGKPFMMAVKEADKNRMLLKYGEIGCIDAQIVSEPRFTNELGVVDLVYKIEEHEPFMLGELRDPGKCANQRQGDPPRGGDGRSVAGRGAGQEPDDIFRAPAQAARLFHE